MKSRNHSNALLVELLIVIAFFMLSAMVLLQVFAKARTLSAQAEVTAQAVAAAQSRADALYASEDPKTVLQQMGFALEGNEWVLREDGSTTVVTEEEAGDGFVHRTLTVADGAGETLVTLPFSRWREVEP